MLHQEQTTSTVAKTNKEGFGKQKSVESVYLSI